MTNEEMVAEIQLGKNVKQNMEQLYFNLKKLIYSIAKQYDNYCDIEDLTQEGYFGLKYAVDTYNPDRGTTFVTYAYKPINTAIYRFYTQNVSSVKLPNHLMDNHRKILHAFNVLVEKLGREPTSEEIAQETGFSVSRVENIKHHYKKRNYSSLNEYANEEEDIQYVSNIKAPDNVEDEVCDKVQNEQLKVVLWECVDELPEREAAILHKYYQDNMTDEAIAVICNISRSRVAYLRHQAVKKLGYGKSLTRLKPFIEDIYSCGVQCTGVGYYKQTGTSSVERTVLKREKYRDMQEKLMAEIIATNKRMEEEEERIRAKLFCT